MSGQQTRMSDRSTRQRVNRYWTTDTSKFYNSDDDSYSDPEYEEHLDWACEQNDNQLSPDVTADADDGSVVAAADADNGSVAAAADADNGPVAAAADADDDFENYLKWAKEQKDREDTNESRAAYEQLYAEFQEYIASLNQEAEY
jgi:hypothetical protein